MPNVNICVFAGHLGKDPEVRHTTSGTAIMSFSLAVNRRVKKGDQWENETDWLSIIHWKPSDFILNALHKGSACLVHGRLQTRQYEKDGQKRTVWEIVAERLEPLGGKGEQHDGPVSAPRPSRQSAAPAPQDDFGGGGVDMDDIPFLRYDPPCM